MTTALLSCIIYKYSRDEGKMKRRRAIINTAGLAGISALTTKNAFTVGIEEIRFGNVIILPEKEMG